MIEARAEMPAPCELCHDLRIEPRIGLHRIRAIGRDTAPEVLRLHAQGEIAHDVIGRHVLEIEIAARQQRARAVAIEVASLGESGRRRMPGRHRGAEKQGPGFAEGREGLGVAQKCRRAAQATPQGWAGPRSDGQRLTSEAQEEWQGQKP